MNLQPCTRRIARYTASAVLLQTQISRLQGRSDSLRASPYGLVDKVDKVDKTMMQGPAR
jgi:hypothetical protein